MRSAKRRIRIIVFVVALTAVAAIIFSGHMLWASQREYTEANESYDQIAIQVRNPLPEATSEPQEQKPEPGMPRVEVPDIGVDFAALKAVNEDSIAWLYCPDTVIDYPVMRAEDYTYYLDRLPDGTRNKNGALFLDYHCQADFSDTMSIIYGHNMKSGRMFGTLVDYKSPDYFDAHPYMYLYTEQGNYRIDLLYGFVIGAEEWRESGFMHPENYQSLLDYAAANSTFESDVVLDPDSKIIVLSTCSYEFNDARYAVVGILRPESVE